MTKDYTVTWEIRLPDGPCFTITRDMYDVKDAADFTSRIKAFQEHTVRPILAVTNKDLTIRERVM